MFQGSRKHLKEVNESYFQHMKFALSFAMGCFQAAVLASVHALIPGLYKHAASDKIRRMCKQLEGRTDHAES